MQHTHFHDRSNEVVTGRAFGYSPEDDGGYRIDITSWEQIGDGGVFTTIEDLLLWDRNFYDNRLGKGRPEPAAGLPVGALQNAHTGRRARTQPKSPIPDVLPQWRFRIRGQLNVLIASVPEID